MLLELYGLGFFKDNKWYRFDDASVDPIEHERVISEGSLVQGWVYIRWGGAPVEIYLASRRELSSSKKAKFSPVAQTI